MSVITYHVCFSAETRYKPVKWGEVNYALLGLFGLIVSSILVTMVSIFVIYRTPALYNKLLKGELPVKKEKPSRLNASSCDIRHGVSDETLCYSSRTVIESTSSMTLTSPL